MIRVDSVMERDIVTADKFDSVLVLAQKLRDRIGAVIILDDERIPVGIVTERDIVEALLRFKTSILEKQALDLMRTPLIVMSPDASIEAASDLMRGKMIRRVPVVENQKLLGIVSVRDVTNALEKSNALLQVQAEELKERANRDSLTGLYNKGYILDQLKYHIALARRSDRAMAFLMIDIDHFKTINDTYGHLCGDAMLKDLAEILQKRSRAVNIVGRYGGEEFAVIGPISDFKSAQFMAERLRRAVEKQVFNYEDNTIGMTISVGVSIWSKSIQEGDEMIRLADDALYTAKRSGRNRVVMSPLGRAPSDLDKTPSSWLDGVGV